MHRLRLRPFLREDFEWFAPWFADPELDAQLGPIDAEWLEAVLGDTRGEQLVAEESDGPRAGEAVAVIGLVWAGPGHPEITVSDLAVRPELRRSGVARRVLDALSERDFSDPGHGLLAYVDPENPAAQALFTGLGWAHTPPPHGEPDPMHEYRSPAPPAAR